jgi:hypothetical protein
VDLFKIQNELIAGGNAEAWYRVMIDGPTFHYRWSYSSGTDSTVSHIIGEHRGHAVHREEPNLTMSWGMEAHERKNCEELRFDWAQDYVNSTVHPFWVDFFWNNALIDRVELCSVDGSHGTIPIPDALREVSDFVVAVAYLVHGLEKGASHEDPGRHLDLIGAKRVRDRDRRGAGSPNKA